MTVAKEQCQAFIDFLRGDNVPRQIKNEMCDERGGFCYLGLFLHPSGPMYGSCWTFGCAIYDLEVPEHLPFIPATPGSPNPMRSMEAYVAGLNNNGATWTELADFTEREILPRL